MRVRLISRMASPEVNVPPGAVVALSDKTAFELIRAGFAEAVDALPPAVEAGEEAEKPKKTKKR